MPGIFISHRRSDPHGTRLYDDLRARFGEGRMTFAESPPASGDSFEAATARLLRDSGTVLVVIGRDWLGSAGCRLLDDLHDPVRREVAYALQHRIRVIPVLVDGARMPSADELPDDLRPLATRTSLVLDDRRWESDVERLVEVLEPPRTGLGAMLKRGWDGMRQLWSRREEAASEAGAKPEPAPGLRAPAPGPAPSPAPAAGAVESVLLGASAPRAVRGGDEFTARFVAYIAAEEAAVRKTLAGLGTRNEAHLGLKTCQWQPGTALAVRLAARGLETSPPEQPFVWDGKNVLVEFDVAVPEAVAPGTVVLKFDVLLDGITVAMLRLDLEIAARQAARVDGGDARANGRAARTAFASYSSEDRQRVLDRIDAVRIAAGLDVFLDCLSLNPSEPWKQRLAKEIPARDLFMLFWSAEAAKSQWVDWEWRRALALKGLDAIQIHPLENGVPPPPELGSLHFGSVAMYARGAGA